MVRNQHTTCDINQHFEILDQVQDDDSSGNSEMLIPILSGQHDELLV